MDFAKEHWLIVAVFALPALAAFYYATGRGRAQLLSRFVSHKLAADLAASFSPFKRNLKAVLAAAGLILLLLALARPRWGQEWEETKRRGLDVLIALDTSKSMLAKDILPDRLGRAKLAILDLLGKLDGDRVGLVAFSGQAFLQCPLTLDYDAFRQTLETIDSDIIPVGGTDIAAAITESAAAFAEEENYRVIILITDGEDLEEAGVERAREAAEDGVKVYTVGVGSEEGELIELAPGDFLKDPDGQIVKTRLDVDTLTEIASATKGIYVPLGETGQGLEFVYKHGFAAIPRREREARLQEVPIERFQWPLGLALLALFAEACTSTRRRRLSGGTGWPAFALTALLATGLAGLPTPANASTTRDAERAYQEGDYKEAARQYRTAAEEKPEDARLRFNEGASLFRAGDFEGAAFALEESLQTDDVELQGKTYYNLGNTYFRLGEQLLKETSGGAAAQPPVPGPAMPATPAGPDFEGVIDKWETSIQHFQNATDIQEESTNADFNRAFVEQKLEELKRLMEQQEQQQEGDQDQDNEKKEDEEKEGEQNQDEQQKEGEQEEKKEGDNQDKQEQNGQKEGEQEGEQNDSQSGDPEEKEGEQKEQKPGEGEEKEGEEKEEQAKPGEDGEENEKKEGAAQGNEGQPAKITMSLEEARRLLESLRGKEKKLPAAIEQKGKPTTGDPRKRRNW